MKGLEFKKYAIWFEEADATKAIETLEDALLTAGIYWDLREADGS